MGKIIKLINVKLNGWNAKTVEIPKKNGAIKTKKKRLSRFLKNDI